MNTDKAQTALCVFFSAVGEACARNGQMPPDDYVRQVALVLVASAYNGLQRGNDAAAFLAEQDLPMYGPPQLLNERETP